MVNTDEQSRSGVSGAATEVVAEAKRELKRKATSIGLAIAFGLGAVLFALFMFAFALAAVAAGFATVIPWWAALLTTAGILALVTGGLGILAIRRFSDRDDTGRRRLSDAVANLRREVRAALDVKARLRVWLRTLLRRVVPHKRRR